MFQRSGVVDCCGAQIIHGFGFRDSDDTEGEDDELNEEAFEYVKEKYAQGLKDQVAAGKHLAFSVAFLNGYQHQRFGRLLKEQGFQCTKPSVNKNHDHRIYLYFLKNNPASENTFNDDDPE
jgi:hypothetical protein